MALSDFKITDQQIAEKGVVNAPDKMIGRPEENKMVFDRLIREAVKSVVNNIVDALSGPGGAGEIGATLLGQPCTAQEAIDSVQRQLGEVVLGQIPDGTITPEKLSWEQELPFVLWLYVLGLPMTPEQRAAVEGSPSLMEIFNRSRIVQAIQLATKEEAEAGADNRKLMTPQRTKEAIGEQAIRIGQVVHAFYDLEKESKGAFLACDGRQIFDSSYPLLVPKIQGMTGVAVTDVGWASSVGSDQPTVGAVSDDGLTYCVLSARSIQVFGAHTYSGSIPQNITSDIMLGFQNGAFYALSLRSGSGDTSGYLYKIDYIAKTVTSVTSLGTGNDQTLFRGGTVFKKDGVLYFAYVRANKLNITSVLLSGASSTISISDADYRTGHFVLGEYMYYYSWVSPSGWRRMRIGEWAPSAFSMPSRLPVPSNSGYRYQQVSAPPDTSWVLLIHTDYNAGQPGQYAWALDLDEEGGLRVTRIQAPAVSSVFATGAFMLEDKGKLMFVWLRDASFTAMQEVVLDGKNQALAAQRKYTLIPRDCPMPFFGSSNVFAKGSTQACAQKFDLSTAYVPLVAGAEIENGASPTYKLRTGYIRAREGV